MIDGVAVAVAVVVEVTVEATPKEGNGIAVNARKTRRSATGGGMTTKGITNGPDVIASIITEDMTDTREGTGNDTAKSRRQTLRR